MLIKARLPFMRRLFGFLGIASLLFSILSMPALADMTDKEKKALTWLLADQLSLAALLHAQGNANDIEQSTLDRTKRVANALEVEIPPFPARSGKSADDTARMIGYLLDEEGWKVAKTLSQKYGTEHELLFEVSSKSNLLLTLYAPGDKLGTTIAEVIQTRCSALGLPQELWINVVNAVRTKKSASEVKSAVSKMHTQVSEYYLQK